MEHEEHERHERHHEDHEHHHRIIVYYVDGEKQETKEPERTAIEIMKAAGIDPATHYLVRLPDRKSYKDDPDEGIHLHEDEKFIVISTQPTPVG